MDIVIGYGSVVLFLLLVVAVLERTHRNSDDFGDFAVAGRSFGSWFQSMAFLNTWLPGTVFIAFAGFSAAAGFIGFYMVFYSLLAILFMFFMAERVHNWGVRFGLHTQADFVGMRYNSTPVRVVAAVIGVASVFPWLVLGFQSLGLVFHYLSFDRFSVKEGILIGIAVLAIRQIWVVRMGMRGIVISDMVQGIFAYGIGGLIALGLLIWLIREGASFDQLPEAFYSLPNGDTPGYGSLYFLSITLTGALGAWCWPDIFVRLFTAKSAATVRKSAVKAAPIFFVFATALLLMSMLAFTLPEVAALPDNVWFLTADHGGPVLLSLAGICVLAATMGNVNAINAAVGTHASQDIIHVRGATDATVTRTAKLVIVLSTIIAVAWSWYTVEQTDGQDLYKLALMSYAGIVQLAPALYFGIFWRRGTALGAVVGMVVGFVVAAWLQFEYPNAIEGLWGLTSGTVGLAVNVVLYLVLSIARPQSPAERERVESLYDDLSGSPRSARPAEPVA